MLGGDRRALIACVAYAIGIQIAVAESPVSLICKDRLISEFADLGQGGCEPHTILFPVLGDINGNFIEEISCHFSNQVTIYAYQEGEKFKLDLKGFSAGTIQGYENIEDHTEEYLDCDSLSSRIREISELSTRPIDAPQRRSFSNAEQVLLVASQSSCMNLGDDLQILKSKYLNEGRSNSKLLCIPDQIVKKRDPSAIRKTVAIHAQAVDGIILIGTDIAPFEFFFRSGYPEGWSAYYYGTTDLPYGNFDDEFWSKPKKKSAPGIAEVVYQSKDYIYPMNSPTPFTFDLDRWVSREFDVNSGVRYRQQRWVSRWLGPEGDRAKSFRSFVSRRSNYEPVVAQRISYARGGESFMMTPGRHENLKFLIELLQPRVSTLPSGTDVRVYSDGDLKQFTRFLSPATTLLVLDEHGNPEALGNLHAQDLGHVVNGLPEIFLAHSCLIGAWGYSGSVDNSFLVKSFSIERPPLAMAASQGLLSLPTIESGTREIVSPYLTYWRPGQSLGQRQVESLNLNFDSWRAYTPTFVNYSRAFSAGQLFLTTSIFGDGTIEF